MIVPRFTQERCVIISDSGVESLVACAMVSEQQQLSDDPQSSVILPAWWEWTDEIDLMISAVDPAVVRQASTYSIGVFPDKSVYPPDDASMLLECSLGSLQSKMLLEAAQLAIRSGIRKVVWPIRVMRPEETAQGESFVNRIADTVDRALLASRLASLDANEGYEGAAIDVVIETPFVDLTNSQMADLASDIAAPIETCWWFNARTLPRAQERFEFWSRANAKASTQVESKSGAKSPTRTS